MRIHLRRTHGDQRKVVARDVVSGNNADTAPIQQVAPMQRQTCRETRARLLSAKLVVRFGTWNVCTLWGLGKLQDSNGEDKEKFYMELDGVMRKANGIAIVMRDFNATIGESVNSVVGPHTLGRKTSSNGEKLVSFASAHGMCVTNTVFPYKRIHQHLWYPPNPRAQPSLKDYILVRQRLRPSVLDTRVFRGADLDSDHRLVVMSLRLKLKKKPRHRLGKSYDVHLLKQVERHVDFLNTIRSSFEGRNGSGDVEQQWTDLKKALVDAGEQHLHQSRQPWKNWISAETLTLTEEITVGLCNVTESAHLCGEVETMWLCAN